MIPLYCQEGDIITSEFLVCLDLCHESDQFHTTEALISVLPQKGFKQSRMTAVCSYGYILVFCGLYIHYELLYYYIIAIYIWSSGNCTPASAISTVLHLAPLQLHTNS